MRKAFSEGENAMEWFREHFRSPNKDVEGNELLATPIAYYLQAGSYASAARTDRENYRRWYRQLSELLRKVMDRGDSILEVGIGEATTLAGILLEVEDKAGQAFGFDVSWSRVAEGKK